MQTLSLQVWIPLWKIPTHAALKNNIIISASKDASSSFSISDSAKNCLHSKSLPKLFATSTIFDSWQCRWFPFFWQDTLTAAGPLSISYSVGCFICSKSSSVHSWHIARKYLTRDCCMMAYNTIPIDTVHYNVRAWDIVHLYTMQTDTKLFTVYRTW